MPSNTQLRLAFIAIGLFGGLVDGRAVNSCRHAGPSAGALRTRAPAPSCRRGADHRPELDYRFSLADERAFLAWIRTALAILALVASALDG